MQRPRSTRPDDPTIVACVIRAADRHGLARGVALAFAWLESRLDPNAQGDLQWHTRNAGELFKRHVFEAPRFAKNVARLTPELWHAYGLFQLMACYHCQPDEHPRILLNPILNADRGCAVIAQHMKKTRGDVRAARLAYVGCGYDGSLCAERTVSKVCDELTRALARYASHDVEPQP